MFSKIVIKRRARVKKGLTKKNSHCKTNNTRSFWHYIREELRRSTIHGLSHIFMSRIHFVERIFWMVCFAGSAIFIAILLSAQYSRFLKSPTVMSVEMNYFDWNISYPAITLCPFYKIDVSLYQHILDKTYNDSGPEAHGFLWSVVSSTLNNLEIMYLNSAENVSARFHPKAYSKLAAAIFRKFPNNSLNTNTNWNIPLETVMTEMGMCHVINSNVAVYDNPLNWHGENQKYARTNIELTIYEGDFVTQITNYTNNYKVYIHHPDELILSTSPSFTFDLEGVLTFGLSVWSTRISNELRPMSIWLRKCRFVNEPLNMRYPVYSYNRCILECRIKVILQLCGCVPHFYKPLPRERVCTMNELKCVLKYKKEIKSLSIPEILLKTLNSKNLPKSPKDCGCLNNCETDIYHKDNENFKFENYISRLQIGITSFPKIRVVRDVIFHTNDILLRSGGLINLFIGSSILSLIELLIIIGKVIIYCIINWFGKYQNGT